jgi:hypothetical protein
MDGRGIAVDFDGHQIVVLPKHSQAATALGSSRLALGVNDIGAVSLHPAGFLSDGRLEILAKDGRRYLLQFSRKQQAAFVQLYQSLPETNDASPKLTVATTATARPSAVAAPTVRGRGYCGQQVVGESHYFDALRKLAGRARSGEREILAVLRREPDNQHDRDAIQVTVDGRVVAYLPREDAPSYQLPLRLLENQGRNAICNARLWWSREDGTFIGSVSLDLADPAALVPVNSPDPSSRHLVIPTGRTYQVTKENEHMDVLVPLIERAYLPGTVAVFGSLHGVQRIGPRSTSQVITVRVDGQEIGELTKQSSAKFLPLVQPMEQAGLACYADLVLTGNPIAVEAKLHITPPEELPAAFLTHLHQMIHS